MATKIRKAVTETLGTDTDGENAELGGLALLSREQAEEVRSVLPELYKALDNAEKKEREYEKARGTVGDILLRLARDAATMGGRDGEKRGEYFDAMCVMLREGIKTHYAKKGDAVVKQRLNTFNALKAQTRRTLTAVKTMQDSKGKEVPLESMEVTFSAYRNAGKPGKREPHGHDKEGAPKAEPKAGEIIAAEIGKGALADVHPAVQIALKHLIAEVRDSWNGDGVRVAKILEQAREAIGELTAARTAEKVKQEIETAQPEGAPAEQAATGKRARRPAAQAANS